MINYFHRRRENRTDNTVIVFEPVTVRAGAMWRAIKIARTALLIWGGVSLAGAAAAAMAYKRGGLEPYLPVAADVPAATALAAVEPEPARAAPAAPEAIRQILPPSAEQPTIAAAAPQPEPAIAALAPPSRPMPTAVAAVSPPEAPPPAPDLSGPDGERRPTTGRRLTQFDDPQDPAEAGDDFELLPDEGFEPLVVARLPRARPDEPLTTGSIERHYEPQPRRFRRLHEVPGAYRVRNPFAGLPPYRDYRRIHPYFHRR